MSYSFTVHAASKAEALDLVEAEFEKVVQSQPVHAADKEQAQAAAAAFIELMPDDADKDVHVTVNGSIAWTGLNDDPSFTAASCSVSAWLMQRADTADPA